MSSKLNYADFEKANMPTRTPFTLPQLKDAAHRAHVNVRRDGEDTSLYLGHNFLTFRAMRIHWTPKVQDGFILYYPGFEHFKSGDGHAAIAKSVIEKMGIQPIYVTLPEKVVVLDMPSWVEVFADGGYTVMTKIMFVSDARETLEAYYREQQKWLQK